MMKSHGAPPNTKDLSSYFMVYACILALDILLLINFTFHIFIGRDHFKNFGWVFMFVLFGVPYLSPVFAIMGAFTGNQNMLKLTGNMNSMTIVFNIPLTAVALFLNGDDILYLLLLAVMLVTKSLLSGITSKIRMYLSNPRFAANNMKLRKIMYRQRKRAAVREDILGKEIVEQTELLNDENIEAKRRLMGGMAPMFN
jgi:hypothetical protein